VTKRKLSDRQIRVLAAFEAAGVSGIAAGVRSTTIEQLVRHGYVACSPRPAPFGSRRMVSANHITMAGVAALEAHRATK
jgi:hypothetical protein